MHNKSSHSCHPPEDTGLNRFHSTCLCVLNMFRFWASNQFIDGALFSVQLNLASCLNFANSHSPIRKNTRDGVNLIEVFLMCK